MVESAGFHHHISCFAEKAFSQNSGFSFSCDIVSRELFFQHFFHRFSFRELIHELVEVADFLHESVFHVLDFVSTDGPCDEEAIRVEFSFSEKSLEVDSGFEHIRESFLIIPREPLDDLIEFGFRPSLSLHFCDIEWVDRCE